MADVIIRGKCACGHPIVAASKRAYAAAQREHTAYTAWKRQRAELDAATNAPLDGSVYRRRGPSWMDE